MSRSIYLPRIQFSLVWLFAAVTAAAICALIARLCGWVESLGVGIAFVLAVVAVWVRGVPYSRLIRVTSGILAALCLWFVGVDWSWFINRCPHCASHWNVAEVRVFGLAIHTSNGPDHCPSLRLIAEDLGAPCPHEYARWHKWRLWGLVFPGPPFHNGTCCISGGDWYEHSDNRDVVRSMARQNPQLGPEFRRRVLLGHDHLYAQKFYADVKAAANPMGSATVAAAAAPLPTVLPNDDE